MNDGPQAALFCSPDAFDQISTLYSILTARCRAELADLDPDRTSAIAELVGLIETGLACAAEQQVTTAITN